MTSFLNSILESLQKRTVERELRQNAKQNKEKTEWEYFWTYCGSRLLLHACSSSSSRALDSIKVLVKITKSTLGHLPKEYVAILNSLETIKAGSQVDAKALRCVALNFASGETIEFAQFFSI